MALRSRRQETLAVLASLVVQAACDVTAALDIGEDDTRGHRQLLRVRGDHEVGRKSPYELRANASQCHPGGFWSGGYRWWMFGILVGLVVGRAGDIIKWAGELLGIGREDFDEEVEHSVELQRLGGSGTDPEDYRIRKRVYYALQRLPEENRKFYESHYASQAEMDDEAVHAVEHVEKSMIGSWPAQDGLTASPSSSSRSRSVCQLPSVDHFGGPEAEEKLKHALDWNFDSAGFGELPAVKGHPILVMTTFLLHHQEEQLADIPEWMFHPDLAPGPHDVLRERVLAFMNQLDMEYAENSYHNRVHACDVMQKINCFFETALFRQLLQVRPWTRLISILAGAMHDLGHTGTTNAFHIATHSELAIRYNDKSPLENMHVAKAFDLMREKPATNWFNTFRKEHEVAEGESTELKKVPIQSRFRVTLIAMVLGTDPTRHGEHVQRLTEWLDSRDSNATDLSKGGIPTTRWQSFLLETALHAADISNCTLKLPMAVHWSMLILCEFWAQGDLEKQVLGSVSMPMFDRDRIDVPNSQVGFIRFVATGLYEPLASLLPEMELGLRQLRQNLAFWEDRKRRGLNGIPPPREVVLPPGAEEAANEQFVRPARSRVAGSQSTTASAATRSWSSRRNTQASRGTPSPRQEPSGRARWLSIVPRRMKQRASMPTGNRPRGSSATWTRRISSMFALDEDACPVEALTRVGESAGQNAAMRSQSDRLDRRLRPEARGSS